MPLNNFSSSIVGRSPKCAAHNAIGKAAYNARAKLQDEKTGITFDYRSKKGVDWDGIFLPSGAPGEWRNEFDLATKRGRDALRQKAYNELERKEDRSPKPDRAQLLYSFILTIPHELNEADKRRFITDYCRGLARGGRMVDAVIHEPEGSDSRNWHAHILVGMRELTEEGWDKKIRAPDSRRDDKDNSFRQWAKDELAHWKDRYSALGARYLKRAGFEQEAERFREGHLTLKEQRRKALERGDMEHAKTLDREPTRHMGPAASAMERDPDRQIRTRKGDINREIEDRNVARRVIRKKGLKRGIRDVVLNVEHAATPARENRGRSAKLGRGAGKVAAKLGSGLLRLVEDFAPALTPEQLEQGQRRQERDDLAADRSQRDRDRGGRGRD